MVGQLLEIRKRSETVIDAEVFTGRTKTNQANFFLSSCRARSRLRRSSKRFVLDRLFPHVGEQVRTKN